MKVSVLKGFVRHPVRLAFLLFFLLGVAGVSHAQAAGPASQSNPKAAAFAATQAKAAQATQAAQPAAPPERRPGGNHEGIQVHGHWTIEVRNPDGKLVSHTEFENSLASNGGAALLAGLLTGTATPGSWLVYLASDNSGDNPIILAEPNSTAGSYCQHNYLTDCYIALSATGSQLGSGGLSGNTVTLTGSATLASSAVAETIAWVETESFVCLPSFSPSACFNTTIDYYIQPLTARNLGDGVGSDPPSVPVSPGQAISVSVVISFGSGS